MEIATGDTTTTGDLEAQHYRSDGRSDWFSRVKRVLAAGQKEKEDKLGFYILKVPEYNRQPSKEFTPEGIRFGLHNRENFDSTGSEALKLSLAVALGLVGQKWDDFCNAIVDDPKSMLQCYGLQQDGTQFSEEEIKYLLALDALFLLAKFDECVSDDDRLPVLKAVINEENSSLFISKLRMWTDSAVLDILKIENQIPFVLVKGVVDYLQLTEPAGSVIVHLGSGASDANDANDAEVDCQYLKSWMECAVVYGLLNFMNISGDAFKEEKEKFHCTTTKHVLEAAYETICGHESILRRRLHSEDYIHIPSATKILASGIKIIGVAGPLGKISYESKCLSLPKINMSDGTASLIRNMAHHEVYCVEGGCVLSDYVSLMWDLIQSQTDLEILMDNGVIRNGMGTSAFKSWKTLDKGLMIIPSSFEHHTMKVAINQRCKLRRYRFWSEFRTLFCSRPWLVLSAITVVLITVATLIQTYVAIIGSNRMNPQFP